jgi:hypothetical protein
MGLAPVMSWGPVPRDPVERARFIRAHRRSVQRWLDDLEVAGVAAHEPERDARGYWWRTQIVLLTAPVPRVDELELATARAHDWSRRARRRRALQRVRRRSAVPDARTRARLGRARGEAVRAATRASIDRARREVLAHPFGAPPASASRSAQTLISPPALVDQTGARVHERRDQEEERRSLLRAHALRRYDAVLSWPRGRGCPANRLTEAWTLARHGEEGAANSVPSSAHRRTRHAIALYERFIEARPPGWPSTGLPALIALASQRHAALRRRR